jgi:hypothetical protein
VLGLMRVLANEMPALRPAAASTCRPDRPPEAASPPPSPAELDAAAPGVLR